MEQAITAELAKSEVVGAAISVVQGGSLRAFIPYGRASIPFNIPVTPRTLFQIGSVGKHVTALAILQLVDAGQLQLDWPIGRVVPRLPDWIAAIPIRNLLGHTGGVPNYEGGFEWDRPYSRETFLGGLAGPAFAPGQTWSYSNSGYVLLGYAIEELSGLAYPDYVTRHLFGPAGTVLARPDSAGEPIVGRAEPYARKDGVVIHAPRMDSGVSSMPDGGVLFSSLDWAPWLQAIEAGRLVSKARMDEMFSRGTLTNGVTTGYGFGWFIDQVRGRPVHYHSGGVPGFVTYAQYYPAEHLMAVATFNTASTAALIRNLVERAVEAVSPNITTLNLAPRPQSARRDERLRAFLAGGTGDDLVMPHVLLSERTLGREPATRIAGALQSADFLERYAAPGGEISTYRLLVDGAPQTRQIGWTPEDRVFLFR